MLNNKNTNRKSAAKIIVVNEANKILLLTNSKTHDWAAGKLDIPGGIIEALESPTEAVIRELKEETGIVLKQRDVNLSYSSTTFYNNISYILFLYLARLNTTPDVVLNFEHDAYSWLDISDALQKYQHPAYLAGLQYLVDHNLL